MDEYPLIHTKLRPPRLRPGHLSRPRLLAQLDVGLREGLILISAPAGYGKTTLAVDWLTQLATAGDAQPAVRVAWLALDENDNDLHLFLRYLIAAVQAAFPQQRPCAQTQSLLDAPQSMPLEFLINSLINDLAALPEPLLLMLDDFHLVGDADCQEVIAQLVRHLPPGLCLLLITRVDPVLPMLSRRRAQQRITEIRAAQLRLTPVEARAILEQISGRQVTAETAVALETQTEGWMIGVQMAAISLRDQADQAAFARGFLERSHPMVMDYLLDDVLARQAPAIASVLLQTSVLERFCASLFAAVANAPDRAPLNGNALLARLDQANLFLVPLDEQGEWFRYHHLFQELLKQRLELEWDREAIVELHHRAGMWLAEHGFIEEALRQLLAAGETAVAVTLIEENGREALNQEDFRTLERWLAMLPEALIAERPSLLLLRAWVLRLQFKLGAIPPILQQVDALLAAALADSRSDQEAPPKTEAARSLNTGILQGERDALRTEIRFWQRDYEGCLADVESALTRLPETHFFARGIAALYQCHALQATGQFEHAVALLNARLADEQLQHPAFKGRVLIAAITVYRAAGDLQRVQEISQALLKLGQALHMPIDVAWGQYGLGLVAYDRDRLEDAAAHWSSVAGLRFHIHYRAFHEAMLGLALIQQIQGDDEQAQRTMERLSQAMLEMNQNHLAPEIDAFRARLALLRGDLPTAAHWAATTTGSRYLPTWFWESTELTRIKVHIAQATAVDLQKAADLLRITQQAAETSHQTEQLIEVWALWALLEAAQDRVEAALTACQKAVQLAEPGGFIRFFVDLGPAMADLLRRLAARDVSVSFINRVLAAFPADQGPALTEREREVLMHLEQGLSNEQIASELVVSVHTVKKHNRNIYLKLGVHGREQAIAQAEALGLLP